MGKHREYTDVFFIWVTGNHWWTLYRERAYRIRRRGGANANVYKTLRTFVGKLLDYTERKK